MNAASGSLPRAAAARVRASEVTPPPGSTGNAEQTLIAGYLGRQLSVIFSFEFLVAGVIFVVDYK